MNLHFHFHFNSFPGHAIHWESERKNAERAQNAQQHRESERERAHPSGQPSSGQRDRTQKEIEPRVQSCSTSTSPFDFESHPSTSPLDVAVRLHPTTSPFDFAFAPIAIAVAALIRRPRSRTQIRRPQSRSSHPKTDRPQPQNRSSSLSSFFCAFDRIMIFFFLGFICVSELRDKIIYLFSRWENVRKCVFCVILIFVVVGK